MVYTPDMILQTANSTLVRLAQRSHALNDEIAMIFADAERRAAPLRGQLQRLQIAEEVMRDLDPDQKALDGLAALSSAVNQSATQPTKVRSPVKALIERELQASALPLSKSELVLRFAAGGRPVNDGTVGSTLSRLVAAGVLVKDGSNRYRLKPVGIDTDAQPLPTQDSEDF